MSDLYPLTLQASLLNPAPQVPASAVRDIAVSVFGQTGEVTPLTGERDQNFHLKTAEGHEYLLKITHPGEPQDVVNFQTEAFRHVARVDPGLPVSTLYPGLCGSYEPLVQINADDRRVVRLFSWMQGEPLHRTAATPALRRNLGVSLAQLDLALRGFFHPASNYPLLWDVKRMQALTRLVERLEGDERRSMAEGFVRNFERYTNPVLPTLRAQVIHNDMNGHNVLVDSGAHETVAGILDFGDIIYAPLIQDLAVACSYHINVTGNPLASVADMVSGYHSVLPLEAAEIDVLFDLIAARLVMTVAITEWRAQHMPENSAYILRNNALAWSGLHRLLTLSRDEARDYLHACCAAEACDVRH
ncbi:phosphotransferase [Paraburkholderia bonniea]|uniref:phosphotransferase n=1 Tax=Paraburkholderia bonniea TaxID=2152891 RepID=UPI0012926E19|nr:phosphotransferase [Paraburkholderia bonniea]WJF89328.1 phosphotransferase [Paraburkholderia bonniea]WJF92644.1 phosphotransferase [Paraburkholderia bonniea]